MVNTFKLIGICSGWLEQEYRNNKTLSTFHFEPPK